MYFKFQILLENNIIFLILVSDFLHLFGKQLISVYSVVRLQPTNIPFVPLLTLLLDIVIAPPCDLNLSKAGGV